MFLIDKQNKKAIPLNKKTFVELGLFEENDLQEWIVDNPNIIGEELLIIQKKFSGFAGTNRELDLLALDKQGRLVIIENKRVSSDKDIVGQSLKYASFCATLTEKEICEIFQEYLEKSNKTGLASDIISEFYGESNYKDVQFDDKRQRIVLVAPDFHTEVTSTVLWLRNNYNVDISCIKVMLYEDDNKLYLDVNQILPIKDVSDYQIRLTAKNQEAITRSNEEENRYKLQKAFWKKAIPVLREKTGLYTNVSENVKSRKDNWLYAPTGHTSLTRYNSVLRLDGATAELRIDSDDKEKNKEIFLKLSEKKNEIEKHFGEELDWREPSGNDKSYCISIHYFYYGLNDEEHWDEIISFLADNLLKIINIFKIFKPLLDEVAGN